MVARPSSQQAAQMEVPEVVVMRLPQYIRILRLLLEEGTDMVSSQQLGRCSR